MKRALHAAIVAAATLGAAATCAYAQIGSVFKGTPAELFNEEDSRRLVAAMNKALDEGLENQPVAWSNPKTNHRGDATVTKSFESKGRACKEVRLRNEAGGRKGESNVSACQVDGRWRLMGSSQLN
jgi:surface antigen